MINIGDMILYLMVCLYIVFNPLIEFKVSIKGIGMSGGDLILFSIFLVYFLKVIFLQKSREKFIKGIKGFFTDYLTLSMLGLLVIMCVSVLYSTEKGLAISETFRFSTYVILFFIIKYELSNSKYVKGFINSYIVCVTIMSLFGIYQYFTGFGLDKKFVKTDGFLGRPRVTVSLDNANNFGSFLIIAIFPMIMLAVYEKSKKKKAFYIVLACSVLANIIFTYSRNALAGFAIGLIILVLIYSWKLILPIGGLGAIALLIPQIGGRLRDIGNSSENFTRLQLWKTAWYMIKKHPLLGVGNGNFVSNYDAYVENYPELYIYYEYKRFPCHNSYLKIQSELGILGSLFFISTLISALIKVKSAIFNTKTLMFKYFYTGFFASMVAFLFMNLADNLFFVPKSTAFFWLLLAMVETENA